MRVDELIVQLQRKDHFILAIDGMCGSGKSTLAKRLAEIFDAHIFCMDDFFLPLEMRTEERLNEPGGNVHYERFLETVLRPLASQQSVYYQSFDCSKMSLSQDKHEIPYCPFNIIEGSYALRDDLVNYYTNMIVLSIDEDEQIARITQRNPKNKDQFINKWIPLENRYFTYYHIYEKYPVINMNDEHIIYG